MSLVREFLSPESATEKVLSHVPTIPLTKLDPREELNGRLQLSIKKCIIYTDTHFLKNMYYIASSTLIMRIGEIMISVLHHAQKTG